jgi:putative transposon-encoded protein
MEIKTEAYQVVEKIVKSGGNSGRVYVPKEWIGKRVSILLLEPIEVH